MKHLSEIVEAAIARGRKRLAVAYGQDAHTIEAVYDAYKDGFVEATLFGSKEVIENTCAELNIDPSVFNIVDEAKRDVANDVISSTNLNISTGIPFVNSAANAVTSAIKSISQSVVKEKKLSISSNYQVNIRYE